MEKASEVVKSWKTKSGLDALIIFTTGSHHCGYVRIPEENDCHGKSESFGPLSDIDVHGGLTFAGELRGQEGWWFGFDCAHSGDNMADEYYERMEAASGYRGMYRPHEFASFKSVDFVERHCESLAAQLQELPKLEASDKANELVDLLTQSSFTLEAGPNSGDRAKENFCAWRAANRDLLDYIAALEAKQ